MGVKTATKTETKTVTNSDGSVTKTVTTTTTETHDDGTVTTKKKVETFIENIPPPGSNADGKGKKDSTGSGSSGASSAVDAGEAVEMRKKAERVPVTTDRQFIKDALEEHNKLRAIHGIGPMTIDEDLNMVAQAWANKLAQVIGKMQHSTNGFGENVFWASGGKVSGAHPVKAWYSEIKDFKWKKIDHQPNTGHFTQVIWKDSTSLGIAMATGKNGHFVVANYLPPGNFRGQYPQNIFPAKS